MNSYKTIKKEGKGEFKDRGSKFIGLSFNATSREDVDEILKNIREEYYDARHHCYGFVIGNNGETSFGGDDGEPSHSAGDPIMNQIKSYELTYTLVIVVRYFGGTKLGVPGLINAYKTAAQMALENSGIRKEEITFDLSVDFHYNQTSAIEKLASAFALEYIEKEYTETCKIKFSCNESKRDGLEESLSVLASKKDLINYQILN